MGLFSGLFSKKTEPAPVIEHPTFDVTDLQIKKLMKYKDQNLDYKISKKELSDCFWTDERIYQYNFDVWPELVKEDNVIKLMDEDYDENKIYLGRIEGEDYERLCALMDSPEWNNKYNLVVTGGKYKILYEEFDRKTKKSTFTLEKGEEDYSAKIEVIVNGDS